MKNLGRGTRKLSSPQSEPSRKASTRWRAPNIDYPKQKRFCQSKEDFHEEYGLSLEGVHPRCLSDEDVPEDQWLSVFTHKRVDKEKIHLKLVRPEFYEECVLLYHMIYQRIPPNHEITVKFARGFVFEKCRSAQSPTKKAKHKVAWAMFAESVIATVTLNKKLQAKMDLWKKKNSPLDGTSLSTLCIKQSRLNTSPKAGPSQSVHPVSQHDKASFPQPACLIHTDLTVKMVSAASKKLQEKESLIVNCKSSIDEAKTRRDKAKGVRGAVEALSQKIDKTKEELKVLEGKGDEASIWKLRAEIMGCQVALDLLGPDACSSNLDQAVAELQDHHDHLMKEVEEANAQFCFVKDLVNQVEGRLVPMLALLPPTAHLSVKGTLIIQNECVACGLSLEDSEVMSVYMLPCRHPYHPLCFATYCYSKDECAQIGCSQTISYSTRQMLFGCHEKFREQSVLKVASKTKAGIRQAKAPLLRKHETSRIGASCKPGLQPEPLLVTPITMDCVEKAMSNGVKGGGDTLCGVARGEDGPTLENGNVEVEFEGGNCAKELSCSPKECSPAELSEAAATADVNGKNDMLKYVDATPYKDQDIFHQNMTLSQLANMGGTKKRKGVQREKTSKRRENTASANKAT